MVTAVFGFAQLYDNSDVLELPSRCLQKGTSFIDEMKKRDREFGPPPDRREYTYRSHYNFAKHKCFVQTDSTIALPLDDRVEYLSQVWEVDAGILAEAYAGKSRRRSLIPNTDELTAYHTKEQRPQGRPQEWFPALMTQ